MTESTVTFSYDGMEYPIDLADLTGRETRTVKQYTDLGMNEYGPELFKGNVALLAVLVGVAMQRSGIDNVDFEKLLDVPGREFEVVEEKNAPTTDDQGGEPKQEESME